MSEPARARTPDTPLLADLPALAADAAASAGALAAAARARLAARVTSGGRVSNAALEADQYAAHALAWMATYAEALRELAAWAAALDATGRLGETERLILQIGCGEYLAQLAGGIPMSQSEIARPGDLGLDAATLAAFRTPVGRNPDRPRQHRRRPRPPRRADAGLPGRRQLRRHRPRRRLRDDPRPVPPLRRRARRPARPRLAPPRPAHPHGDRRGDGRARRLRPHHPRGIRRLRPLQDRHVRRLRGALPRLHRRRLPRHPLRDRRRAHPRRRHRGAKG